MAYIREYPPPLGPDPFHECQRPRPGLKMGEENSILVRLLTQRTTAGGTPPPRIYRSIYNFNSRVLLFSDLLILFFLTQNQFARFLPKQSVVRILYPVRSPQSAFYTQSMFYTQSVFSSPRFIPNPYFIPSPQSVVRSPCFTLTGLFILKCDFLHLGLFPTSYYCRSKLARLQHDDSTTWFQTSNLTQSNKIAVAENKT